MILRFAAVFAASLSFVGCSDDGTGPTPFPPPYVYTSEIVAHGSYSLVELNEAGHALLGTDTGSLLWNGDELIEVPIRHPRDLGPDDEVLGGSDDSRVLYWKNGETIDLGPGSPLGLTSDGTAYFLDSGAVYSWNGGEPELIPGVPYRWEHAYATTIARIVGDDGVIYGAEETCSLGYCYYRVWAFVDGDTISVGSARAWPRLLTAPANRYVAYTAPGGAGATGVWHDDHGSRWFGVVSDGWWRGPIHVDVNSRGIVLQGAGGLLVDLAGPDSLRLDMLPVLPGGWSTTDAGELNDAGQLLLQITNGPDSAVVLVTPW